MSELDFDTDTEVTKIQMTDPDWEDYVMQQFRPDELFNGKNPTVNGLRRVCEVALGPIVGGKVNVVQCPSGDGGTAVVEYELTVECINQVGSITRVFSSAADAHYGNTDPLFRKYLTAIAETRAEARALRKAMKIKTAAADELSEVANLDRDVASPTQERAIEKAIRRKSLDINQIAKDYNLEVVNGKLVLGSDEAKVLIRDLNKS
jgi:hypothetical protein